MRTPFVAMDGLSNRAQFYTDYVQNIGQEIATRFLSRTLKFGVSSGLAVADGTTGLVTGVNVASGLAFNPFGFRTLLTGTSFLDLTASDNGKFVVLTRSQVSGFVDPHPLTGVTGYTRLDDSSFVSAVTTPSETLGHVKLALIQTVSAFPTGVALRTIDLVDRDPLLVTSPFSFVTIGPAGDTTVDFAGNDEQPFLNAFEALTITSGGTIYVKRGDYNLAAVAPGNVVSGLTTVHIVGEGRGTNLQGGGSVPGFRFQGVDDVLLRGISCFNIGAFGIFEFRDASLVRFQGNYVSGRSDDSWALELTSGITRVILNDNQFVSHQGIDLHPWRTNGDKPRNTIGSISCEGNYFSDCEIEMSEQIGSLTIRDNFLINSIIDNNRPPINRVNPNYGNPTSLIIERNIVESRGVVNSGIRTHASGAVITSNSVYAPAPASTIGIWLTNESASTVSGKADYAIISNNHVFNTRVGTADAIDVAIGLSGVVVVGNTVVGTGAHAGQGGIDMNGMSGVVDGNIIDGFQTAGISLSTTGGSWGGTANNTSNKTI